MIRYFCNICGTEIRSELVTTQPCLVADVHHETGLSKVIFGITRAIDGGAFNAGHICGYCLGAAFTDLAATVVKMQATT